MLWFYTLAHSKMSDLIRKQQLQYCFQEDITDKQYMHINTHTLSFDILKYQSFQWWPSSVSENFSYAQDIFSFSPDTGKVIIFISLMWEENGLGDYCPWIVGIFIPHSVSPICFFQTCTVPDTRNPILLTFNYFHCTLVNHIFKTVLLSSGVFWQ